MSAVLVAGAAAMFGAGTGYVLGPRTPGNALARAIEYLVAAAAVMLLLEGTPRAVAAVCCVAAIHRGVWLPPLCARLAGQR